MKITTDVNFAGLRSAGNALTRVSSGGGRAAGSDQHFAVEFSAKLQRERAMIDALAIAQTSRQLVQKAIDASSRLRAIAFEAMTTGNVNVEELSNEVSGIQGTLAGYGESITIPVDRSSPAATSSGEVIGRSFHELGSYAAKLLSGNKVSPDMFASIESGLKPVAAELDARIELYSSGFTGNRKSESVINYSSLNRSTADLIAGNPAAGMASQGSLNTDNIRMLTMA